jgi:hypothetical protein
MSASVPMGPSMLRLSHLLSAGAAILLLPGLALNRHFPILNHKFYAWRMKYDLKPGQMILEGF